jgi:hypothetical protein
MIRVAHNIVSSAAWFELLIVFWPRYCLSFDLRLLIFWLKRETRKPPLSRPQSIHWSSFILPPRKTQQRPASCPLYDIWLSKAVTSHSQGLWEGVQPVHRSGFRRARKGLWISDGPHSLCHRRFIWIFSFSGVYSTFLGPQRSLVPPCEISLGGPVDSTVSLSSTLQNCYLFELCPSSSRFIFILIWVGVSSKACKR